MEKMGLKIRGNGLEIRVRKGAGKMTKTATWSLHLKLV